MGSKVWRSAVTSDRRCKRDFWSLDWHNEAVTYQSSSLGDASTRLPFLLPHRSTFPSAPSLCLSAACCVAYPALLIFFLFMWRLRFISPLRPTETSRLMHHNRCLLVARMREESGRTAIGRIGVLSDSSARERVFPLSMSQNNGDADCGGASVPIKKTSSSPVEWSAFFLCFSQSWINSRIVTDDLSSSGSHQGRAQSKYRMNRQLHQWD